MPKPEEKKVPEFDSEKCIYCGACVSVCPSLALELNETKLQLYKEKCIKCYACTKICPVGALTEGKKVLK